MLLVGETQQSCPDDHRPATEIGETIYWFKAVNDRWVDVRLASIEVSSSQMYVLICFSLRCVGVHGSTCREPKWKRTIAIYCNVVTDRPCHSLQFGAFDLLCTVCFFMPCRHVLGLFGYDWDCLMPFLIPWSAAFFFSVAIRPSFCTKRPESVMQMAKVEIGPVLQPRIS